MLILVANPDAPVDTYYLCSENGKNGKQLDWVSFCTLKKYQMSPVFAVFGYECNRMRPKKIIPISPPLLLLSKNVSPQIIIV